MLGGFPFTVPRDGSEASGWWKPPRESCPWRGGGGGVPGGRGVLSGVSLGSQFLLAAAYQLSMTA